MSYNPSPMHMPPHGQPGQFRPPPKPIATWVEAGHGWIPNGLGVVGGYDVDGQNLYIGRARHENDVIPGKIVTSHSVCYVPWGGKENAHHTYQALTAPQGCDFVWVEASGGSIPTGAIQGGHTSDNEKLYIGRSRHEGSLCVGKIQPSHGCCYIPFGGSEVPRNTYEVLCVKDICLDY